LGRFAQSAMLLSALDLRNVATSLLRFTVFSRYLRKLEQCREACSGQTGYSRPVRRGEAKEGQALAKALWIALPDLTQFRLVTDVPF